MARCRTGACKHCIRAWLRISRVFYSQAFNEFLPKQGYCEANCGLLEAPYDTFASSPLKYFTRKWWILDWDTSCAVQAMRVDTVASLFNGPTI